MPVEQLRGLALLRRLPPLAARRCNLFLFGGLLEFRFGSYFLILFSGGEQC
jgi:hypothetical protein